MEARAVGSFKPFISVLIPTKNRPELLRFAVESLLRQSFADFEVVVSDDHSIDDASRQVVMNAGDERFRLVEPPNPLTMAEHYEFVASQARGEYITYLPDRAVLYKDALARIAAIAQSTQHPLIGWNNDRYDDRDPARCILYQHARTNQQVSFSADALLRRHFDFTVNELGIPVASPASSACHRRVMMKIRERAGGRFIQQVAPDVTYSVATLVTAGSYLYMDSSLSVGAGFWASTGANFVRRRAQALQSLAGARSHQNATALTPCPGVIANTNLVANDLLMLKALFPEELNSYELDLERHLALVHGELAAVQESDGDVEAEMRIWRGAVLKMGMPVAFRLLSRHSRWRLRTFVLALYHALPASLRSEVRRVANSRHALAGRGDNGLVRTRYFGSATVIEACEWAENNPFERAHLVEAAHAQ